MRFFCRWPRPVNPVFRWELVLLFLLSAAAHAQSDTFSMMEAVVPSKKELRYDLGTLGSRKVDSTTGATEATPFSEHRARFVLPVHPFFTTFVRYYALDARPSAVLPSGRSIAGPLQDVEAGIVYRRVVAGNNQFGLSFLTGSASNRLFAGSTQVFEGMLFYSWGLTNAQFVSTFLTYSNHRVLLNGVPLPGFAAKLDLGEGFGMLAGFPYAKVWLKPSDHIRFLGLSDFGNLRFSARGSFFLTSLFEFFSEARSSVEIFSRADREVLSDRIFYAEKEVVAGMGLNLLDTLAVEASAGHGSQRSISEADTYSNRLSNLRRIEDGFVFHLRGRITL